MKRPLLSLSLGALLLTASAQHLSPEVALTRALDTSNTLAASHRRAAARQRTYTLGYESSQLYAFASDDGFLLTAADQRFPALLGYSDEGGSLEKALASAHFQLLLESYEQAMADLSDYTVEEGQIFKPASVADSVPPMLSDLWDQFSPYYRRCPIDSVGDTCCVGCVALSMGEVMRYWQYPATGTGSYTYFDESGCLQELTADFSEHTYDWANMLDSYADTFTDTQAEAVALLLSDCGVAVNMRYGSSSSGARCVYQPQALYNFFGYDEAMQLIYRGFFPQQEWDSIMFTELSEGRPLLVAAHSPSLSHALVCDGYDTDGYFHMCFGNEDGDANGYYYFTWLTPQQPTWYDINSPERGMNLLQSIVRGVQPQAGGTPRHFYAFSHMEALGGDSLVVHSLGNIGWQLHDGTVALALKSLSDPDTTALDSTTLVYRYSRQLLLEEVDDTVYTDTLQLSLPENLSAGTYRLVPVFEQDNTLIEARTMVGTPNYLLLTTDGTSCSLAQSTDTFAISVSNLSFPDTVVISDKPAFAFTLTNNGAEYSGRIYIALTKQADADLTSNIFAEMGLSLLSGESATRTFYQTRLTNVSTGQNYLRILADIDLFSDSLVTLYQSPQPSVTVCPAGYTAISHIEADTQTEDNIIYDLAGRQLPQNEALKPGVYIINGKKILITP